MRSRWAPYYVERFNALQTALGTKFNGHPGFGGISTQETAMGATSAPDSVIGIGSAVPAGKLYPPYTTALYRDRSIEVIEHAATAFPDLYFYWRSNFIRGNTDNSIIGEIIDAVKDIGHFVLGGPDILPGNVQLEARFYPFYQTYNGVIPLMIESQPDSYSWGGPGDVDDDGPFYTMTQIFEYARDNLHADIIPWTYIPGPTSLGAYDYDDAVLVMQANPTF
jgi:hypothetical protein